MKDFGTQPVMLQKTHLYGGAPPFPNPRPQPPSLPKQAAGGEGSSSLEARLPQENFLVSPGPASKGSTCSMVLQDMYIFFFD